MRIRSYLLLFVFIFCALSFSAFATDDSNNQRGVANKIYMTLGEHPTSGDIYFVNENSTSSQDSLLSHGGSWDKPFNTIDFAISACTANDGDIIYVAAGHTEDLSTADAIDADVAGITIIGLGNGEDRPKLTFTDTAGEFVIGAANVTIENFIFAAGISNVTNGIEVEALGDNFTLLNCEVIESSAATYDFADFIVLASGADGIKIDGLKYRQLLTTPGDADHFLTAGTGVNDGITITNSDIRGSFTVSAIWSDKADTAILIDDSIIINTTNGQHAIEFTSTATGLIQNTSISTDAQATALDPGSLDLVNVIWNSDTTADVSGIDAISPALGSTGVASIGTINSTTTDSLHGKIGTDTEMADNSLYDLWVLDQVDLDAILLDTGTTIPGTIATAQSDLDIITGATGVNLLVATQASIDAIETDTSTTIPGTITTLQGDVTSILTDTGTTIPGTITTLQGNVTDILTDTDTTIPGLIATAQSDLDIITGATGVNLLTATQASIDNLENMAEKSVSTSTAVMTNGDTIFTISGGPIKVIDLVSVCITTNDATASTLQYSADPTVGAATTFSGASASLANFAAGGGVVLNTTSLATAPDLSTVLVGLNNISQQTIVINEGIITIVIGVGTTTGTWKHYLRYVPLASGVTVTGS